VGTLVIDSVTGLIGTLTVSASIKDAATGLPVNDDESTRFTVILGSPSAGASASSPATMSPITVMHGTASFQIHKPDEGAVTVGAIVHSFPMPVQPGTIRWSSTATSTTTTLNILQFEQTPTSGTYFPPPADYQPTTSYFSPLPTTGTSTAPTGTATAPSGFTLGGTRYDTGVTVGYTFVAPSPGSHFHGPNGTFHPGSFLSAKGAKDSDSSLMKSTGSAAFGNFGSFFAPSGRTSPSASSSPYGPPPAAMRNQMVGVAQGREADKLNAGQFNPVMQGIQTGRKPEGAEGLLGAETATSLHQTFESIGQNRLVSPPEGMGPPPLSPPMDLGPVTPAPGSSPWAMGSGEGSQEGAPLIFDPAQGGWSHEDVSLGDHWAQQRLQLGKEEQADTADGEETESPGTQTSGESEPAPFFSTPPTTGAAISTTGTFTTASK